jgi:hypothetical protein
VPDAFEEVAVDDLLRPARDLLGIGAFKPGPEVPPPLIVHQKSEAFQRGILRQCPTQG